MHEVFDYPVVAGCDVVDGRGILRRGGEAVAQRDNGGVGGEGEWGKRGSWQGEREGAAWEVN